MATRVNNKGEFQEKLSFVKKNKDSDEVIIYAGHRSEGERILGVLKGEVFAKFVIDALLAQQKANTVVDKKQAHNAELYAAMEFGFLQHEKGNNLEMANIEFGKLF